MTSAPHRKTMAGTAHLITGVFLFLLSACSSGSSGASSLPQPEDQNRYASVEAACLLEVPESLLADCSTITVPAHWGDVDSIETIDLHVVVFTTSQTPGDATPVFFLPGGPGGDIFGEFGSATESLELIADLQPLVVFTPRGSVGSEPSLACTDIVLVADDPDGQKVCIEQLVDEGVDLSAYSTRAAAQDVNALRQALGYEKLSLLSDSYGTLLAQVLMTDYPDTVDSVVMSTALSLDPAELVDPVTGTQQQLENLFVLCEESPECAEAYPGLAETFQALVEQLNDEPIYVDDDESGRVAIDGTWLVYDGLALLFDSPETAGSAPLLIEELSRGETEMAAQIVGEFGVNEYPPVGTHIDMLDGSAAAFLCNDQFAEVTEQDYYGDTSDPVGSALGAVPQQSFDAYSETCGLIEGADQRTLSLPGPTGDMPTLLIAGGIDGVAPPEFSRKIASDLPNSTMIVLDGYGHNVLTSECGFSLILDFLADPTASLDSGCVETARIGWNR